MSAPDTPDGVRRFAPDAAPPMACRVCGMPLNRYLQVGTRQVRYTHPRHAGHDTDDHDHDHEPDPAPLAEVDARHVCDFCSDERILYTVSTTPVSSLTDHSGGQLVSQFGTDWSACVPCAGFLQSRDLDGLHRRLLHVRPDLGRAGAAMARFFLGSVMDSQLPGLAVSALGRWPAIPPPAAILLRVRDRLAALIGGPLVGGPLHLPLGLDSDGIRAGLAVSVSTARLYWIDAEFTDLADTAAATLPATVIDPADLPAPHGLLAWARPVGPRADLVAASWSSHPDGLRVVGYRSIGGGLDPVDLQQVRERVGWLGPRVHTYLPPADPVDGSSPVAVLLVTCLLIAQRLAQTRPAEVDRAIRRAYQRNGRAVPDVLLVGIRGTVRPPDGPQRQPAAGSAGYRRPPTDRQYRWWVKAHWRQQAYGPRRALRRPILVLPQLRGPHDKPIKASTIVRVLSADPPRPATTPGSGIDARSGGADG